LTWKPAETGCDDGDPCTENDMCDGKGNCAGVPSQNCVAEGAEAGMDGPVESPSRDDVAEAPPSEDVAADLELDSGNDGGPENLADAGDGVASDGTVADTPADPGADAPADKVGKNGGGCSTSGRGTDWAPVSIFAIGFVVAICWRRRRMGSRPRRG